MSPTHYRLGNFPPKSIDWVRLVPLIGKANAALGKYDSLVATIPNSAVLLAPLVTQEAVLSSRIEGTNVTMGEVLAIEAGAGEDLPEYKRADAEEVLNYRKALGFAANALQERPLSHHLLREAHAMLMNGVRGRDKGPGSFRTTQNWIGRANSTIEQASFVPISPTQLGPGMDRWLAFLSKKDEPDALVQLAIVHAEFEALHPFNDGNGRLGRMVIPLFLFERGLLCGPHFYISGYLEAHRDAYIEHLRDVSSNEDWTGWCAFFLEAVVHQATENQRRARSILSLYHDMQKRVARLTHTQYAPLAIDFLFSNPIFYASHFVENASIHRVAANRLLRVLREADILKVIRERKGRKPAILAFGEILNLAEGKQIF